MGPSASLGIPRALDRERCVQHRLLDAGRGRELVDDVIDAFACAGRAGRDSGQLTGRIGGVAGRSAGRHRGSPTIVVGDASLDGHHRGGNGCNGVDGPNDSRTFALADFFAGHWFGGQ